MDDVRISSLLATNRRVALTGAGNSDPYLAFTLARMAAMEQAPPLVIVVPDEDHCLALVRDLRFFLPRVRIETPVELSEVMHLPRVEASPYAEVSPDRMAMMMRLGALFVLSQGKCGSATVLSAASLRRRIIPGPVMAALVRRLEVDQEVERDQITAWLVECGFARTQIVEDPGTFSVRGGIVDLFPPLQQYPSRVELFGDQIESIRLFDPSTQRTLRSIEHTHLHPVRETIPTAAGSIRARILEVADAVTYPSSQTRILLEELESGREFFGIEGLTPIFHDELVPLWTVLPAEALWVLVDQEALGQRLLDEDAQDEAAHLARMEQGRLTLPPDEFFVSRDAVLSHIDQQRQLQVRLTEPPAAIPAVRAVIRDNADLAAELRQARNERGEEILKTLVGRVSTWRRTGRPVLISAGSQGHARRLEGLLRGYEVTCTTPPNRDPLHLSGDAISSASVYLLPGVLSAGFRLPGGLVVIAEQEIFGPRARERPSRRSRGLGEAVVDLGELKERDLVVHAEHGVGRYHGLKKLDIKGVPADFLLLEYAGGDRLYLPIYRMDQVHRYLGGKDQDPKLDRLGGATWSKKKRRVGADVRQMAEELLQLYAQRSALPGQSCPAPDALFGEFEATFSFTETGDQLQAIQQVMDDLCAPRPMDRLVCGDVGFGKTEVALRAAFWIAMSGRQVALLAPTTVLVEQHLRTFAERLAPYPLRVETLSRFRKRKEQARVIEDLKAGRVDVAIGTHRLFQQDVQFADLGLLVIDEEHRFGVGHKEKFKRLRTQVDVLSLTATPIPRTLNMGLSGLRSISVIATPPVDRLAIRTFACRFDGALVAGAIRKELARGGQVFFVHNRVQSIDRWAERIAKLVPEARVRVGHGKMDSRRLERVMFDFVSGGFDVLVCTAIIESGLDIPRANTMFVNQAERFGLAQLYQLRGRIGRSRHRAFCYLLVPGFEAMTEDARKRLNILQRYTELGSGFSVAQHDLEIRGAGDLLGARQSGQIAAVGFETYAKILEEAVAELKGEPITRQADPELNAAVPAYIPDDFVEDTGQRLVLYKRLSNAARRPDDIDEILSEMKDRYGPIPREVETLGELMEIKGLAARLGATAVDLHPERLSLSLGPSTPLEPERVIELVSTPEYRLTPEMRLIRTLDPTPVRQLPFQAKNVLQDLLAHAIQPD